ncbi:MAG: DMT family transporter [Fidelibacterota bacterium]
MTNNHSSRFKAILQALLVTFLWSTSFVIIKLGLDEIPPLTFAGLRYALAFLFLLPFVFHPKYLGDLKNISGRGWVKLVILGLLFYTFTQGAQFVGLSLLPAVTVSLLLNFTPLLVAIMGIFLLAEKPNFLQWSGIVVFLIGIGTYFYPTSLQGNQGLGLLIMTVGVLANSSSAVLGRHINREARIHPIVVTLTSMGIGSFLLLIVGLLTQGFPAIGVRNLLLLLWLAAINTAFAFSLWNVTLRTLTAMESSIVNGTMLIQIAILAWIFLGEQITSRQGLGMVLGAAGAVMAQMRSRRRTGRS